MKKTIFALSLLVMTAASTSHAATLISTCKASGFPGYVNLSEDLVSGFTTVEAQHGYFNAQGSCVRTYTPSWVCSGVWTGGGTLQMSIQNTYAGKVVTIQRAYGRTGQNPTVQLICQDVARR